MNANEIAHKIEHALKTNTTAYYALDAAKMLRSLALQIQLLSRNRYHWKKKAEQQAERIAELEKKINE